MFEEYYSHIGEAQKPLVIGEESIQIALFLSGKAKLEGKDLYSVALVNEEALVQTIPGAVGVARTKHPMDSKEIEKGTPRIKLEKRALEDVEGNFDFCIINKKAITIEELTKLGKILKGKLVLNLSLSNLRRIQIEKKGLLGKKTVFKSLKQYFMDNKLKVISYDIKDKRMILSLEFKETKFSDLMFINHYKEADLIIKEIQDNVKFTKNNSTYCIVSDDKEYLYYINVQGKAQSGLDYNFTFLDEKVTRKVPYKRGKVFSIIVMPNLKVFKEDIEAKEILIVPKKEIAKLFGETNEPY